MTQQSPNLRLILPTSPESSNQGPPSPTTPSSDNQQHVMIAGELISYDILLELSEVGTVEEVGDPGRSILARLAT